jgi:Tol biopolymer transport system component
MPKRVNPSAEEPHMRPTHARRFTWAVTARVAVFVAVCGVALAACSSSSPAPAASAPVRLVATDAPAVAGGSAATRVATPTPGTTANQAGPWIVYSSPEACEPGLTAPSGQGLCLVRPDGTDAHPILAQLMEPKKADWSRDGRRLAFAAVDAAGAQRIWTSGSDGANPTPVETDAACDVEEAYPAWSPDGTQIAFMCLHGPGEIADLAIVDLATGATRTVLPGTAETNAWAPRWSPDGASLVINLEHVEDGQFTGSEVATIDLTGGDPTVITPRDLPFAGYPDWSPDGSRIVFATYGIGEFDSPAPGASNLFTIRPDGTDLQPVTTYAAGAERAGWPTWAPDGSEIMFTLVAGGAAQRRIAFVAPDGSGLQVLDGPTGFMARLQP